MDLRPFEQIIQKYSIPDKKVIKNKYDSLQKRIIDSKFKPSEHITKMLYRPFDNRWTIYGKVTMDRYRPEIEKNILNKKNIVLCLGKEGSTQGDAEWTLAYISTLPTDI